MIVKTYGKAVCFETNFEYISINKRPYHSYDIANLNEDISIEHEGNVVKVMYGIFDVDGTPRDLSEYNAYFVVLDANTKEELGKKRMTIFSNLISTKISYRDFSNINAGEYLYRIQFEDKPNSKLIDGRVRQYDRAQGKIYFK